MHVWSQLTSLALAAFGFAVSLWPAVLAAPLSAPTALHGWSRLRRFPIFWFGLALLVLVVAQSLNPSWTYEHDAKHWWMRRLSAVSWLPTSVVAPFDRYNLWRVFVVLAAAWMLACSIWVGATRRRSLQTILVALAVNGVLVAAVGIVHRMSGDPRVLWIREFKGAVGFGPLVYHNHGAAYIALVGIAAFGLAIWFHDQAMIRGARSSPALIFAIIWFVALVGVAVSGSRAGFALSVLFSLAAVGALALPRGRSWVDARHAWVKYVPLLVLLGAWGAFMIGFADTSEIRRKFDLLRQKGVQEWSVRQRIAAREKGVAMFNDRWAYGWGAGSFRYMFVPYARTNPEVDDNGRAFWEFLHNDWLQMGIEFGLAGSVIFIAGLGWCVARWVRGRGWNNPVAISLGIACLQTLVHGWMDFPFQNPAILLTWLSLVAIALRWLELDALLAEARRRPAT